MLEVVLIRETMKVVKAFVSEHNHELELPETRYFLISQREVLVAQGQLIEMAHDAGLKSRETFELTMIEAGGSGSVGYTVEDQKSYLRARRYRSSFQRFQHHCGHIWLLFVISGILAFRTLWNMHWILRTDTVMKFNDLKELGSEAAIKYLPADAMLPGEM